MRRLQEIAVWGSLALGLMVFAPVGPLHAAMDREAERPIACGRAPKIEDAASVRLSVADKTSPLSPEVIRSVVRASFGTFRGCYEDSLRPCPGLNGRLSIRFTIRPDGSVSDARVADADQPDPKLGACVVARFRALKFPSFNGRPITVVYPVTFVPGG